MDLAIVLVIGILIGFFGRELLVKPKTIGVLRVDRSDPDDGPYLFLEMKQTAMNEIQHSKYVMLEVNLKDYISRD